MRTLRSAFLIGILSWLAAAASAAPAAVLATPDVTIQPKLATVGPAGGNSGTNPIWLASSADGSHVAFRTREALTANDTNSRLDAYDWSAADGLQLVSAGSTSEPPYEETRYSADGSHLIIFTPDALLPEDTDTLGDAYDWSAGQLTLVSTGPTDDGNSYGFPRAVTPDGGTVYFEATGRLTPGDSDDNGDLYASTDGVVSLLSATATAGNGANHASFSGMSADGSHVFFQTHEALDPADRDTEVDLYEWSAAGVALVSTSDADTGSAGGSYHASTADGSHVYFWTDGRLTPEDTDLNADTYERFEGVTRLISTGLAGEEAGNFVRAQGVSDDGTRVVLEAAGRLTAADTDNENDLYLIAPGAVTMLTTGPTADPSDGVGGTLLSMSADASRILLSTRASLVASDTDGALDLYLHTSAGVELVSTAPGNPNFGIGVEFWASSADLQRVIFLTGEPLDAGDTDIDSDVAIWDGGDVTRLPLPSSAGPEFNGASADAETLFIRVGVPMAPGDTDNGRDIYQFSLPHVVTPPAGTFVEADGTTLTRNGQPFRLHGAAIYGTSNPHDPGDDHTTQVLDWAEDAHLNTLRLVNMFVEDGLDDSAPYRESDWVHVDQVLAEIGARGMVAVLDLSAFRNHLVRRDIRVSGHTATCQSSSRPAGIYEATDPYRAGLASEWQALIHFVTSRINTVTGVAYRDDPTIAVISLAGEPEPPNTEYCGKATDTATLTEFYRRTLAMLATEDPNHLHSTGGLFKTDWEHQCAGCGGSGIDGHAIFALADNTLPALHTYPWRFETFGKPIDFQSPDLGAYAVSLGKPWFTEEFGWPQRIGDEPRATDFRWLYALQETYGSAGALFWNLGPEVAGGSHDVNPNTPLTWAAVVAGDGSGPDPVYFVRGAGTSTQLNGQPFTFTGMNIYNANSDGWCANNMDGGLFEQALTDIDLGGVHGGNHGVIRAWFFEPLATAGLTGTRDWTRFDRTIAAAKAAGYHVIPTFGNQWGECGHKGATAPYKTIDWYRMGYTQLQPEDSVYGAGYLPYRDWVAQVVDRYKDEPAILAWQLLNEAETNPAYPAACPPGPEAFDAIASWAGDVSGLIKSIDSNHLVSLGTIGAGQCGTSGGQYKDLHAIPTIDLCEYHDYDPWTAMPGDAFNGMALRTQQCGELGKPIFVGEVGLKPVDVGGSYDSRTASLRAKLQTQRAAGVVGHVVWSWGPAPRSLTGYDIGPGDQVPELLAAGPTFESPTTPVDSDWVAPFITLTRPNRSLYTLNEPLTAAFSCTESGSSGLATCVGTQPNGSTLSTSTPGHFTFTVDSTDHVGNHRSISLAYDVTAGDVTTTVPPGPATVSTDPGGLGASTAVPVQTSVAFTAPAGAETPVSIDMHAPNIAAPSGYAILGSEVDIDLGGVTRPPDNPIVITFIVDSSTGANPATITVSRTNADSSTDVALPCDALPAASPDPCYTAAFVGGAGTDVRVTVRTTHASMWLVLKRKDGSAPKVDATVTGTAGPGNWYRSNVSVAWTVTDPQSAILTSSGCGPSTITSDTAGTTKTCTATSEGGTATKSVTVKRDSTGPTLTCQPASFVLGKGGAKVNATITDALSGAPGPDATATADTSSVGPKAVNVTGEDKAGNSTTVSCGYTVTPKK